MKKVFLLLTSAMFGVASFAADFEYDESTQTLSIPYNQYGTKDADNNSIQWQAGGDTGLDILSTAVYDLNGNTAWIPAIGETFVVNISGVPDMTGTMKFFLIDEDPGVDYWGAWSEAAEFEVVAGEKFTQKINLKVVHDTQTDPDKASFGKKLGKAALVIGYEMPKGSSYAESDQAAVRTLTECELTVTYKEAIDYENPIFLEYKGKADKPEDGYKYQSTTNSSATGATVGKYVNVKFSGKAVNAVPTLMYSLIDGSAEASYFTQLSEFVTFATNIEKGATVSYEFSAPLSVAPTASVRYQDVLFAQSTEELTEIVFEKYSIVADVTDAPKYKIPTAVDEVAAADFAIEGGMVYSAGVITVYNVAGQVVATASQEFNVNTLAAGAYFIVAEEGTIKFVK